MLGPRRTDFARITVAGSRGGTVWVSSIETLTLKGRRRLNTTLPAQTEWTWVLVGEPTVRQQGQEEFDEELTTLPLKPDEGVWEETPFTKALAEAQQRWPWTREVIDYPKGSKAKDIVPTRTAF